MTHSHLRGAVVPPRDDATPASFDRAHGITASELMWRLSREAYGADYPDDVQPFGMTTWWTLGRFISGLRLGGGRRLVDLACGRGGVGLWLARATRARLTGVDFSPAAVREAASRAPEFVPAGRASFVVGDLAATGLESGTADGAVCADAVFFAPDRVAVFAEVARILRPGARFVFTADESDDADRPRAVPDWTPIVEAGGLVLEGRENIPHWREGLQAMYAVWLANIDEVRRTLGEPSANDLTEEATQVGPTLSGRTGVLYTAVRP
jgi:ubiquinone/menaquinone biosynthesis C-methylase UbiE